MGSASSELHCIVVRVLIGPHQYHHYNYYHHYRRPPLFVLKLRDDSNLASLGLPPPPLPISDRIVIVIVTIVIVKVEHDHHCSYCFSTNIFL